VGGVIIYQGGNMIELLNEDCMAVMARYPDNYFDLACVDPPYGIGIDGQKEQLDNKNPKHNRKGHEQKSWDNCIPSSKYFDELFRVSKNQIIWGANYFVEHLNKGTKGWVVWYKGQQGLTMSDAELAYSSFQTSTRVVTINRVELLKDGTIHPTQKPLKLYKWLFQNYADPGQRILDTHGGSFSSAIAAHYFGCDMVICEIDKDYYEKGKARFENETKQIAMF
jgi:site-specific DNA-methyltransferase (adenine-specific)